MHWERAGELRGFLPSVCTVMEIQKALRYASKDTFLIEHGNHFVHVNDKGVGLLVRAYKNIQASNRLSDHTTRDTKDRNTAYYQTSQSYDTGNKFAHDLQNMHRGIWVRKALVITVPYQSIPQPYSGTNDRVKEQMTECLL